MSTVVLTFKPTPAVVQNHIPQIIKRDILKHLEFYVQLEDLKIKLCNISNLEIHSKALKSMLFKKLNDAGDAIYQ